MTAGLCGRGRKNATCMSKRGGGVFYEGVRENVIETVESLGLRTEGWL